MDATKNLSIVKVDNRPYRAIVQENWGLTDEQMRGKHVHHRIPVAEGGTNDPTNLYVCSPSFHAWVWHNGEQWIEWASEGARKSAEIRRKLFETSGEFLQKFVEAAIKTQNVVREKRKDPEYDKYYRGTRGVGGVRCMELHKDRIIESSNQKTRKPVILTNIDTGEVLEFVSLNDACRQLDLHQGNLSSVLSGSRKRVKRWRATYAG
jgi:hypothetical protein